MASRHRAVASEGSVALTWSPLSTWRGHIFLEIPEYRGEGRVTETPAVTKHKTTPSREVSLSQMTSTLVCSGQAGGGSPWGPGIMATGHAGRMPSRTIPLTLPFQLHRRQGLFRGRWGEGHCGRWMGFGALKTMRAVRAPARGAGTLLTRF